MGQDSIVLAFSEKAISKIGIVTIHRRAKDVLYEGEEEPTVDS